MYGRGPAAYGRRPFKARRNAKSRSVTSRRRASFRSRVLKIVGVESKFLIFGNSHQPFVGTPESHHISQMQLGISPSQRVGNWVKCSTVYGNIIVTGNSGSAVVHFGVRVGVALWRNDESTDPFDAGTIMADSADPAGAFSVIERGGYTVLWTKYLNVVNNDDNSQIVKTIPFNVDLNWMPKTLYDGAEFKKYHLFFFYLSDDISGALPVNIQTSGILRYTDA